MYVLSMSVDNSYRSKTAVRDSWHTRNNDGFSCCLGCSCGFKRGVMFTIRGVIAKYQIVQRISNGSWGNKEKVWRFMASKWKRWGSNPGKDLARKKGSQYLEGLRGPTAIYVQYWLRLCSSKTALVLAEERLNVVPKKVLLWNQFWLQKGEPILTLLHEFYFETRSSMIITSFHETRPNS